MNQYRTFVLEGRMVAEQPLATCSKDLLDREGAKNKPVPVPSTQTALGKRLFFPATGIRGGLRRAARDVVRDHVIEATGNTKPFDLDTHYMLTLGGIKGSGEEDRTSISMIHEVRDKNPLLNLFGAGDAGSIGFLAGRLSVGNALCEDASEPVIFSGARSDDLYRDKDQVAYLSEADLLQLTDRAQATRQRSQIKNKISSLRRHYYKSSRDGASETELAAITTDVDALEQQLVDMKSDDISDNSVGMPLAGWQAIPQGARMSHRMILKRSRDVDLGMLLASLERFSLHPLLGAHYAQGNGLVSCEWDVFEITLKGKASIGRVSFEPFSGLTITDSEDAGSVLSGALSRFHDFMAGDEWDFSIPGRG